jgi:two-component system sensor histidine kinase UhpB
LRGNILFSKAGSILILQPPSMGSQYENFNILIIEDNPADFCLIEQMLLSSRLRIKNIYSAARLSEAVQIMEEHKINLVLLDLSLPDSFGIDSFLKIRNVAQKIPVIIMTGTTDSELALLALQENAQDYLVKGEFNKDLLIKSIEYSIERKKAEEKILASEEKYRQMFYKNPFPMWVNDLESLQILEVNDAAIQYYGYERKDFLRLRLTDIQQSFTENLYPAITNAAQSKLRKHRKKNGDIMIVEFTYYPISFFGRTAMQAQINDVTEKLRLEDELALKKQQIVEAVLNAQEAERTGIGKELHDNINQILAAVQLKLGFALDHPNERVDLITKSMENTAVAIEEIRKLSKELVLSGNLKNLSLVQSIKELIKDILSVTKIRISFDSKRFDETSISHDQKITIYRIIQEQLNNILKHAQASSVIINLDSEGEQISLCIADNGRGFDTGAHRNGIGITNMMGRVKLFGDLKIDSSPGEGCRLKVVLNPTTTKAKEAA